MTEVGGLEVAVAVAKAKGGVSKNDGVTVKSESSPEADVELARKNLRQRWELASVLNFLHVLEPVIESDMKISAEDVETALIEQNDTLAQLHIALLKGILSSNKQLKPADGWIISLSKTLPTWWPWVTEGDFPLAGAKGEEISIYKDLEPTTRLLILKALCEVRADQYDVVSYINEAMKDGTSVSCFRREKLGGDGNRIAFWYDGSENFGHRLYKEVQFFEKKRAKGKDTAPATTFMWETLATNLEEFKTVMTEFSSSQVKWEVDLSKSLETDVIPVVEKHWKKKQRALHKKQREQKLLDGFRSSGITRSCRNQKPVDYSFGNYDKAIMNAIKYTNKFKTNDDQRREEENPSQHGKRWRTASSRSDNSGHSSRDGDSAESDTERNIHHERDDADDSSDEDYDKDSGDDRNKKVHSQEKDKPVVHRPKGSRFSERLAGIPGHTIPESMNIGGAKNRSRQRPSVNTAAESVVVQDSEDESSHGGDAR